MVLTSLAALLNVIAVNIYKQGENKIPKPLPKHIKDIFLGRFSKCLLLETKIKSMSAEKTELKYFFRNKQLNNLASNISNRDKSNKSMHKCVTCNSLNDKDDNIAVFASKNKRNHNQDLFKERQFTKLIKDLNKNLATKDNYQEYYENIQNEWRALANVIDKIFAYTLIFIASTILLLFIYFWAVN